MTQDKTNKVLNVPPLRFPEFTGEWKKCKLGEITVNFSRRNKNGIDYPMYSVTNDRGFVPQSEQFEDREMIGTDIKAYKIIRNGEFAYNPARINVGSIAKYQGAEDCMISSLYVCFDVDRERIDSGWFYHLLKTPHMNFYYNLNGEGGVRIYLFYPNFARIKTSFPSKAEQHKIADLFNLLTKRIETQIRVIEDLQSLKKAIRKQMFSELLLDNDPNLQIKDVLEYEQPTKYLVSNTEYSDDVTRIPVLTANKAFILGYTDDINGIYSKGKCIILDDFTLDCKLVDFPFKVKSSAIKILTAKRGANIRYLYEYLKFLDLGTSEHKRHYIAEIEPLEIVMPDINIANNIANALELMDKRIYLAENMLIQYRQQKQFLLQQMFI